MIEFLENNSSLFPVMFIGMWVLISYTLSAMGGWKGFANCYSENDTFVGEKWYMQSIKVGLVNYGSCVTLGANMQSLYMAVLLPFRLGHPPLSIPYSDIEGIEAKGLVFSYVDLKFAQGSTSKVRLSKKQADRLEKSSGETWKYERT